LVAAHDDRTLTAAGDRDHAATAAHALEGCIEVVGLIQRLDFNFVGEQHIDMTIHEVEEAVSVTIHAKAIGEG
jgi:hypothetical protein